jgi:hypothetical protein
MERNCQVGVFSFDASQMIPSFEETAYERDNLSADHQTVLQFLLK